MNKGQLIERIERAWREFTASYEGLSDAELTEPGVTGDWSIKDIIAHVSAWEEEALRYLPIIMRGDRVPRYKSLYGSIDAFNAQMVEQSRDRSLEEVLLHQAYVHQQLLSFLETVPEEHIARENRFRRRLRLDTYGHYPEHSRAIRSWRDRRQTADPSPSL